MTSKQRDSLKQWAAPADGGTIDLFLGVLNYKHVKPEAADYAPSGTDILIKVKQIVRVSTKVDGKEVMLEAHNYGLKDTLPWNYVEPEGERETGKILNKPKPSAAYQILGNPYLKIKELLKSLLEKQGKHSVIEELERAEVDEVQEALKQLPRRSDEGRIENIGNIPNSTKPEVVTADFIGEGASRTNLESIKSKSNMVSNSEVPSLESGLAILRRIQAKMAESSKQT